MRWPGLILVLLLVVGIVFTKHFKSLHTEEPPQVEHPTVLIVADLNEADEPNDVCADMIRAVRGAGQRGVPVKEMMPGADPQLLKRYHILTAPTVLIFDPNGKEAARFEGESKGTVEALRTRLAALK